jgi:chromosome segregation ATPase
VEKKNAELTIDVLKGQTIISELQEGGAAVDKKVVSKALNDNAVLLGSFKDLEDQLIKKTAAVEQAEAAMEASREQIASLQSEMKTLNDAGDLQSQLSDAEELVRRMQSDEIQKNRDIETLVFERDAAQESLDVLETQCQTLLQEKSEDTTQIESLKSELGSHLQSSSQEGNEKLIDAMNLSSQYVSEIARLQDSLQKERLAHEATKEHSVSLDKEIELNRSVLVDMQDKLCLLRDKDFKVRELSSTKDELLVELADKSQQIDLLLAAKEEQDQIIRELKSDCDELQSRIVVIGNDSDDKEEVGSQNNNKDNFTSSATVRKLRADLLQALQKVEENAEAHSKLLSSESELRALKLLFEDSKLKLSDAEARGASMMEQLLGVDGDISRARNANADYDKVKTSNEKLEKKSKKLEKERDAGREVLAQVEGDLEDLRERFGQSENMLSEIRMENTALRESASTKVKETKEIKALHKDMKKKDDEIQRLNNLLESSRSIAVKAKTELKTAAMDDTVSKIVSRKRGLSKRDGNAAMPGLANLPPPPGGL